MKWRFIASCRVLDFGRGEVDFVTVSMRAIFSVFVFASVSSGQIARSDNPWTALFQIDRVLRGADVSGSLAYRSCGFHTKLPDDLPPLRSLANYSGDPSTVLQRMFADDPRMRVTWQGGKVRMMETDVPMDLLNFRIHHLSFYPPDKGDREPVQGPRMALFAILQNPEVQAFKRVHHIGPSLDAGFLSPGDAMSRKPVVHGELKEVTISEALDYVLETFPGFWIYEDCVDNNGERSTYFNFVDVRGPTLKK